MYPYDGELLAAVAAPPATIAEVVGTMRAIDGLCIDGDGLKWFNGLYLQVTEAVQVRVAAQRFADPAWLAELDVQFAGLYFDALRAALAGGAAPGCWRALFDRRNQTAVARIQFALAGVNAHINHDLPVAIVAACRATGTIPNHAGLHYADYTATNATLDALVEAAKQTLHVRLLGDALPPVSHLEDTIAAFSVTAAREAAWDNAEMLWALRSFPLLVSRAVSTLDGLTTVAGKSLLVQVPMVKALTA
jgi:hypothetical protein